MCMAYWITGRPIGRVIRACLPGFTCSRRSVSRRLDSLWRTRNVARALGADHVPESRAEAEALIEQFMLTCAQTNARIMLPELRFCSHPLR